MHRRDCVAVSSQPLQKLGAGDDLKTALKPYGVYCMLAAVFIPFDLLNQLFYN